MEQWNPDRVNLVIEAILKKYIDTYMLDPLYDGADYYSKREAAIQHFLYGGCGEFAMMMLQAIPSTEIYIDEVGDHLLLKIEDAFYDVRGFLPPYILEEYHNLQKANEINILACMPNDYVNEKRKPYYEEMFQACAMAGQECILEHPEWSQGRSL